IRRGPHDTAAAAEQAAQLLKSPAPPSAIFAASDTQAIGVLAAADRLGVAVPGQLSVVGFDDIESAAFLNLSTIRQPLARSGTEGAQRLCALLRGERVRPLRQELPIELMARGTSARAQQEAPTDLRRVPQGAVDVPQVVVGVMGAGRRMSAFCARRQRAIAE